MHAADWDSRYAGRELVWGSEPNRWVVEVVEPLPPGRALDVACGEGRNALWLARRGWAATGVDFSAVALERAAGLTAQLAAADGPIEPAPEWVCADVLTYRPEPEAFDLVVLAYLQLPSDQRATVVRAAAAGLAPRGTLLVVAHDATNLTEGVGGPQDARVLYSASDVVADLDGVAGLRIVRAERVRRPTDAGPDALDALVVARRD